MTGTTTRTGFKTTLGTMLWIGMCRSKIYMNSSKRIILISIDSKKSAMITLAAATGCKFDIDHLYLRMLTSFISQSRSHQAIRKEWVLGEWECCRGSFANNWGGSFRISQWWPWKRPKKDRSRQIYSPGNKSSPEVLDSIHGYFISFFLFSSGPGPRPKVTRLAGWRY